MSEPWIKHRTPESKRHTDSTPIARPWTDWKWPYAEDYYSDEGPLVSTETHYWDRLTGSWRPRRLPEPVVYDPWVAPPGETFTYEIYGDHRPALDFGPPGDTTWNSWWK